MNNLRESVDLFAFSANRGTCYVEKFVQFLIASIRQRIGTISHVLDSSELLPQSRRQFRRTSFVFLRLFLRQGGVCGRDVTQRRNESRRSRRSGKARSRSRRRRG